MKKVKLVVQDEYYKWFVKVISKQEGYYEVGDDHVALVIFELIWDEKVDANHRPIRHIDKNNEMELARSMEDNPVPHLLFGWHANLEDYKIIISIPVPVGYFSFPLNVPEMLESVKEIISSSEELEKMVSRAMGPSFF